MKIQVQTEVGGVKYNIDVEEQEEIQTLHKAIILGNPPKYCQECKNDKNFKMDSNKDREGNFYVNVVCMNSLCFAKAKLGLNKGGGFFWHKFEKYVKNENNVQQNQVTKEEIY